MAIFVFQCYHNKELQTGLLSHHSEGQKPDNRGWQDELCLRSVRIYLPTSPPSWYFCHPSLVSLFFCCICLMPTFSFSWYCACVCVCVHTCARVCASIYPLYLRTLAVSSLESRVLLASSTLNSYTFNGLVS